MPRKTPEERKLKRAKPSHKLRAKLVFNDWKDNNFKGLNKSMLKFGYSEQVAKAPVSMLKSKAWTELVQELLPDTMLAEKHNELLNARVLKVMKVRELVEEGYEDEDGNVVADRYETVQKVVDLGPDTNAVAKGLELAYKVKGMFNKGAGGEGDRPPNSTIYNLFYKPEIRDSVKQLEAALKKQLYGEPLKDDDGTIPTEFGREVTPVEPATENGDTGFDDGHTGEDGDIEEPSGDDTGSGDR